MAAKLTRLTHKIAIQRHLVAFAVAVLAPGGKSGNFWLHPRILFSEPSFYKNLFLIALTRKGYATEDLCSSNVKTP